MQEFFSKYFISHIDTGPSMLSNGSNIMLLTLPILILSIFTQSSSNTVKETLVFRNILYRYTTAFLA